MGSVIASESLSLAEEISQGDWAWGMSRNPAKMESGLFRERVRPVWAELGEYDTGGMNGDG